MNIQKIKSTLIWTAVLVGIGVLLFYAIDRKRKASVEAVVVNIKALESGRLIQEKEVKKLIFNVIGFNPNRKMIRKVNSRKLESALEKDPRIENAEVYFDGKNRMHVAIKPREVIARVSDVSGTQYFLDEKGKKIPVIRGGAVRVPLINGYVEKYTEGFADKPGSTPLKEVFLIVKFIRQDAFLRALIEQLHVEESGEIVLIPKVGKEKLVFGSSSQMKDKFDNLKIFYRDGMTKIGWNRYPELNLKFTNQVVLVDGKPSSGNEETETAMRLE